MNDALNELWKSFVQMNPPKTKGIEEITMGLTLNARERLKREEKELLSLSCGR